MNPLIAYPLTWDDIELRANNTIGIYKIKNKIAVLSCVSYTAQVDDTKDYMHGFILTNFSTDFTTINVPQNPCQLHRNGRSALWRSTQ